MEDQNQGGLSNGMVEPQQFNAPNQPVQHVPQTNSLKPKKSRKLIIMVAASAALLIGGSAFGFFGIYQQSPNVVWDSAMKNTAEGLRTLSQSSMENKKEGGKLSGTFRLDKPTVVDGSIESKSYKNNSIGKFNVGFAGNRVDVETRTVQADNATSPDVYVKATGLNSIASLLGLVGESSLSSTLSSIEGKWYVIDHTLLEQYAQQASPTLTPEDVNDIQNKLVSVINEYVFTSDESKAVLTKGSFIGKEDFEGTSTFRYESELHKDKLREFVIALKDAAKTTKLKELLESGGRSLEESLEFSAILEGIDQADLTKVKTETWVSSKTKLLRNIRFTPSDLENGDSAYLDLGLDYQGGDDLIFKLAFVGSDSESQGHITTTAKINRNSYVVDLGLVIDIDYKNSETEDIVGKLDLKIEPSDEPVDVEKPEGATNVIELLGSFLSGFNSLQTIPQSDFDSDEL